MQLGTSTIRTPAQPLKVVFLIGADSPSARAAMEAVCEIADIQPLAIRLDTAKSPIRARMRNLRRNVRREGLGYIPSRIAGALCGATESATEKIVPREQILSVLRRAFPDRCFSL